MADYHELLKFTSHAFYRITVQGRIPGSWYDRYGPFEVTEEFVTGEVTLSILKGEIKDQSQLSVILNSLHDLHLSVVEVMRINQGV